jgi:hypothetical protein
MHGHPTPRRIAAIAAALLVLSVGTGTALAGEVTGNGDLIDVQGQSFCMFSGQEDLQFFYDDENTLPKDPADVERGDPGYAQNWGQIPKAVRDTLPEDWHPGVSCNPTISTWPE